MKTNIKMIVNPEQSKKVQDICVENGVTCLFGGTYNLNAPFLYIGNSTFGGYAPEVWNRNDPVNEFVNHKYQEIDADLFIGTNGTCVEGVYENSQYLLHKELIELVFPTKSEYLIFVEGKSKPSKIHPSLDEAEKEARRLSEKEMKEVHILKSVKKFKPKITIEEF